MRRSISLKVFVLSNVVYLTWWMTSSLMAKPNEGTVVANPASGQAKAAGKLRIDNVRAAAPAAAGFNPNLESSHNLENFDLHVEGHTVSIHASVNIMDRHAGRWHIWRLRILDEESQVMILDDPYMDQKFQMTEPGIMNPRFDELLTLQPGHYRAILSLHKIFDGVDVQVILNDKFLSRTSSLISVPTTFVIK